MLFWMVKLELSRVCHNVNPDVNNQSSCLESIIIIIIILCLKNCIKYENKDQQEGLTCKQCSVMWYGVVGLGFED